MPLMPHNSNEQYIWEKIPGYSEYSSMLQIMEHKLGDVISGLSKNHIYLLEHESVITAGTSAKSSEITDQKINIPIFHVGRGGKYTYHGPGQRVIYPIIDLNLTPWNKDLKFYLNFLHNWIINILARYKIESFTHPDHIGIWVLDHQTQKPAKIAAIGIRARKWVAYHGIAININNDLNNYQNFIPCGISDLGVTSLKKLGYDIDLDDFDQKIQQEFSLLLNSFSFSL